MNNEVKFRVFDKIDNRLATVVEISFIDKWVGIPTADGNGLEKRNFRDVELMQWTGFKDRDGVDIYVGDIVEKESRFKSRKYVGPVIFNDGMFNAKDFYFSHYDTPGEFFSEEVGIIKVLSNIYEAPELLEKK